MCRHPFGLLHSLKGVHLLSASPKLCCLLRNRNRGRESRRAAWSIQEKTHPGREMELHSALSEQSQRETFLLTCTGTACPYKPQFWWEFCLLPAWGQRWAEVPVSSVLSLQAPSPCTCCVLCPWADLLQHCWEIKQCSVVKTSHRCCLLWDIFAVSECFLALSCHFCTWLFQF